MRRRCVILLIVALCGAAESLAQAGGRIDADVSRTASVDAPRTIEAAFGPEAGAEALIIRVIATAKISPEATTTLYPPTKTVRTSWSSGMTRHWRPRICSIGNPASKPVRTIPCRSRSATPNDNERHPFQQADSHRQAGSGYEV